MIDSSVLFFNDRAPTEIYTCGHPRRRRVALPTWPRTPGTVPPLGHWLYFLPTARPSVIGADGHPRRDGHGLLPPVPLPRRMWAGSRVAFLAPMTVGAALTRLTTLDAIQPKRGASGDPLFVNPRERTAVGWGKRVDVRV